MQQTSPTREALHSQQHSIHTNRLLDILTAFISERVDQATHNHNATESAAGKLDPLILATFDLRTLEAPPLQSIRYSDRLSSSCHYATLANNNLTIGRILRG
jgi:hypothetical protein